MSSLKLIKPFSIGLALCLFQSTSAAMDLAQAVDAYWQRHPEAQALEAHNTAAEANVSLSKRWIGDDPRIALRNLESRSGIRTESELEIALPLPSGRSDRIDVALADKIAINAEHDWLRLKLATELIRLNADLRAAMHHAERSQKTKDNANALWQSLQKKFEAGEIALNDVWLAESEYLRAGSELANTTQTVTELVDQWQLNTGERLAQLPPPLLPMPTESVPSENTDIESHPALRLARGQSLSADAAVRYQQNKWLDGSAISLIYKREDDAAINEKEEMLGVQFSMPLHFGAHRRSEKQEAIAEQQLKRIELQKIISQLTLNHHRAQRNVQSAIENQLRAAQRKTLANQRIAIAEKAYRIGELSLVEFLRIKEDVLVTEAQFIESEKTAAHHFATLIEAQGFLP